MKKHFVPGQKKRLLDKVQTEPALEKDGRRFVISVTNLLERLLDYRQVIDGDENRDKRMHCTFNILNFYKDNREEMYIRYINKLFHLHHDADNFVEAGLTLQLYAKLLDWKNDHLSAYLGYPSQPEWQRKEMLYLKIIQCFDKGKAWEYGIPLCKDLAEVYEKKLFQYKKLSEILQREAAFFNNILEGSALRQNPSYYRVVYHGTSFPPFLRNKAFVYRGDECLKLDTIRQHLMTEFPSATILSTNSQDESLKECEAQNIQIVSVKPVPEEKPEFHDQDVPSEIKNFYSVNEVNVFQFDRPYYVGRKDGINEFRNLWLERTLLKTSYKLPGILRWYEVVQTQVVHLSPVCAAIENIKTMNMQLCHLVERCKSNTDVHFKQMEMRLQGVVTGAVNGGIPKYQEAFFAKEFLMKHPEESNHLTELTSVLWEQIDLISRGLHLHGEMSTDDMKPLHRNLVQIFTKLKQGLSDSGSPRSGRLCVSVVGTPPRPSTPGGGSYHSSGSNRSSIISQEEENTYMDPPELTNRLQQSHGTGSDPALNHSQATGKGLSTSVSSSNLDSRGTRPQMKRFVSNPDTSLIDSSIPPPLPVRKNSDPRILSLYPSPPSVPTSSLTPDDRSTSQNRPTVKHRTSLLSLNGSIGGEQGLSPLQETGMVEHPHRVQPNEEMTTPKIPPRTPVIPPRPAIFRPPANTISVIKDAQQSVKEGVKSSPPPIPSRAGKRLSNSLPENTKM